MLVTDTVLAFLSRCTSEYVTSRNVTYVQMVADTSVTTLWSCT